jgi:hypothetical protein
MGNMMMMKIIINPCKPYLSASVWGLTVCLLVSKPKLEEAVCTLYTTRQVCVMGK